MLKVFDLVRRRRRNSITRNLGRRDVRNFWDLKTPLLFCWKGEVVSAGQIGLKSFPLKECYRIDGLRTEHAGDILRFKLGALTSRVYS